VSVNIYNITKKMHSWA